MYEIEVEREFCAAHAIVIAGAREPTHGHNWHVVATIGAERLDPDGLLCDFHAVEACLDHVLTPFRNVDLNHTPPFDQLNPTAEMVARHVADALARELPRNVRVRRVSVTEAPGCRAIYLPDS